LASRRAEGGRAKGDLSAKPRKSLRILEVSDRLAQLVFDLVDALDIIEA
jgi:hypothetical protein